MSVASDRYQQVYNTALYVAATRAASVEGRNALIDAALILCGADPERWPAGQQLLAEGPPARRTPS